MIEDGIKCCPYCGSQNVYFSKKKKRFCCEDCEKEFDKPAVSEMAKKNTVDTRKIAAFLASSIKLTAERDLISSVTAESNGADHRTYIELNRCEYDNGIRMSGTQQEMYDSWIRNSDVFILVVSVSGIGEWTEKELAVAAERKKLQNIKTLAFVQNGVEDGGSAENKRWRSVLSEYENCFDELERYDDISDLYDKVKKCIKALRDDNSIGTVIKDCQRVGYDIVITGISEKSREYVYSLADKFNIMNNENFRENENNSLIFNLQINLDAPGDFRVNVNDYYFILTEENENVKKRIGECYQSRKDDPYMYLDISIEKNERSNELVSELSKEVNDNFLYLFDSRSSFIGKDSIRKRLEQIQKAYGDFQKGLAHYNDGNYFEAEKLLLEAVKFGFIVACFYLGCIYSDDKHPDFKDLPKAEKNYRMAAERGISSAQYNLGLLLEKTGNLLEAEKYYRIAAERGNVYAQNNLGALLNKAGNFSEAEKYYRMAADWGDAEAQYNLGVFLDEAGNFSEAEKYYRMASDQGNTAAQSNLGILFYNAGNFSEAEKYYRMAADRGNTAAQSNLGTLFYNVGNFSEAEKYCRMAAQQGDAQAQYNVGVILYNDGDFSEAEKYYRMAAEQGSVDAQNNLGYLLQAAGRLSEAEKYYRMAADRGNTAAQSNLGALFYNAGNFSEAVKYFRMAAQQGDAEAQFYVGFVLHKSGDLSEAERYYRMAAEQGSVDAQNNLEYLLGTSKNLV